MCTLVTAVCTLPSAGICFDKRFQAGVMTGLSGTFYDDKEVYPALINGGILGGYLEYGLNRVFAISLDGAVDFHMPYNMYEWGIGKDEDGKEVLEWSDPVRVDKYMLYTGAFSVLYAIDLYRIVPVFSVGALYTRVSRRIGGVEETSQSFGIRIGGGFEYYLKRFSFGAGFYTDRYFKGDTGLVHRVFLSLRGAVVFSLGAKSLE